MRELNTDYLGSVTVGTDGQWFTGWNNGKSAKPQSTLNSSAQNMIESVVWKLGSPNNNNGEYDANWNNNITGITPKTSYIRERSTYTGKICSSGNSCNDDVLRTPTWTGKVALMYPSDYYYATSGGNNTNIEACLNMTIGSWSGSSAYECYMNDWMLYFNGLQWTISPSADGTNADYAFASTVNTMKYDIRYSVQVLPVVHLKSSVKIVTGEGTEANPYILA